jgi:hypothetical protein
MMGVSGSAGDPAYPPKDGAAAAVALGQLGDDARRAASTASAGTGGRPDSAIATREHARARAVRQRRHVPRRMPAGRARPAPTSPTGRRRSAAACAADALAACARSRSATNGMADGAIYYDAGRRRAPAEGRGRGARLQRHRHAAALLNSRSRHFPDGLANRSGLVGRNLMFHPYAMVMGLFDEPLEGYKGPTGCCIMSQEFYESDPSRGFVRGYSFEILRGFGPVYTALWAMSKDELPWGADHHRTFAEIFDRPPAWSSSPRTCPIPRTR